MPELPEVETVRKTLRNMILGRTISSIDVHYSKIIKDINVDEFKNKLVGKTFIDIERYGKYLIFILDDIALISHLRMEGKYFIKDQSEELEKHEHIVFNFKDGGSLRYHDVRKFGTMDLRNIEDIYSTNPIHKLGLEPFDEKMNVKYLKGKLENKGIAIKTCLLDQHIFTGLGNIYVDEVLFLSKLNPKRVASSLTTNDFKNIIENSIKILNKAIELGGTTIRSYTSSLGVTGLFQNELNVHTKKGEPCLVCSTTIEKTKVNGRGTYFCPTCQK
jgi:formamidopyrimidine-DNA glycosylase